MAFGIFMSFWVCIYDSKNAILNDQLLLYRCSALKKNGVMIMRDNGCDKTLKYYEKRIWSQHWNSVSSHIKIQNEVEKKRKNEKDRKI